MDFFLTTQILKGWKKTGKELEKSWNFDGLFFNNSTFERMEKKLEKSWKRAGILMDCFLKPQILKGWKKTGKKLEKSWNFDGLFFKTSNFERLEKNWKR